MATTPKNTIPKANENEHALIKHYSTSAYVEKKTQAAKETLQKFPVPEKYCR